MQTGRDVAESHREDAADKGRCGRDAAARESHLEDAAGRGTVAELLTGSEVVQYHREENTGKDASKEEQLRDACRA